MKSFKFLSLVFFNLVLIYITYNLYMELYYLSPNEYGTYTDTRQKDVTPPSTLARDIRIVNYVFLAYQITVIIVHYIFR